MVPQLDATMKSDVCCHQPPLPLLQLLRHGHWWGHNPGPRPARRHRLATPHPAHRAVCGLATPSVLAAVVSAAALYRLQTRRRPAGPASSVRTWAPRSPWLFLACRRSKIHAHGVAGGVARGFARLRKVYTSGACVRPMSVKRIVQMVSQCWVLRTAADRGARPLSMSGSAGNSSPPDRPRRLPASAAAPCTSSRHRYVRKRNSRRSRYSFCFVS